MADQHGAGGAPGPSARRSDRQILVAVAVQVQDGAGFCLHASPEVRPAPEDRHGGTLLRCGVASVSDAGPTATEKTNAANTMPVYRIRMISSSDIWHV